MASGMPTLRAYSSVAAMPSSTWVRARPMSCVGRLARERTRQGAHHQHQAGRAERLGLVDGAAVVLQRGAQAARRRPPERSRRGSSRIKPTPASLSCRATGGEPAACDLVAPRIDGADAAPGAGLDDGGQRELLPHRRRVDRQVLYVACEKSRIRRSRARPARAPCAAEP